MDTIGAIETAKDFMVAGTAPDSLYGMCESMWQPDMVSIQDNSESELQPVYVCPSQSVICVMGCQLCDSLCCCCVSGRVCVCIPKFACIPCLIAERGLLAKGTGHLCAQLEIPMQDTDWMLVLVQGPEQLFETVSQCLLSGMDRDALSGWGAVVYVM